jgi:hypothetical protein
VLMLVVLPYLSLRRDRGMGLKRLAELILLPTVDVGEVVTC